MFKTQIRYYLILLCLCTTFNSFSCSCPNISLINAYSYFDFIGTVQFENLREVNDYGLYASEVNIQELFKGNTVQKIFINSQKGSSCNFIPEENISYFILGSKNENGQIEISLCTAFNPSSIKNINILKQHKLEVIDTNLKQRFNGKIKNSLFNKKLTGYFIYKVILNSDLSISQILPINQNALDNFNSGIRFEFLKKISYHKINPELSFTKDKLTSYIILNWEEETLRSTGL